MRQTFTNNLFIMEKVNINKFFVKFNSCPLCGSSKKMIDKFPYKNRYSDQISNFLKIDEKILIKKVQNVKCRKCSLIYKSSWFNKEFYKKILDNLAPTHPRGWDTISKDFSKENLKNKTNYFLNSIKKNNKKNITELNRYKRSVFSIVDSIQAYSTFEKNLKKNYLDEISNENINYINENKNKILKLIDKPERFKRFSNYSDHKLFNYIKKHVRNLKLYGELGCPLWGMLKIANNNGCKTTFIRGDEFYFWGNKCKKETEHCCSKLDETTNYIKKGIDYFNGKKIDFLGVFQYLDHLPQPMEFFKKIFSISRSVGFVLEEQNANLSTAKKLHKVASGSPVQHFTGWDENTMKFVAKKFNKKLKSDFSDIKISGNSFFLLH